MILARLLVLGCRQCTVFCRDIARRGRWALCDAAHVAKAWSRVIGSHPQALTSVRDAVQVPQATGGMRLDPADLAALIAATGIPPSAFSSGALDPVMPRATPPSPAAFCVS